VSVYELFERPASPAAEASLHASI